MKLSLALHVTRYIFIHSFLYAFSFAFIALFALYAYKGFQEIDATLINALWLIYQPLFGFFVVLFVMMFSFRVFKHYYLTCRYHQAFFFYDCDGKVLERFDADIAFRVSRRWMVLSMWILLSFVIVISSIFFMLSRENIFFWMNLYSIYPLFLLSLFLSFNLLIYRCKKIGVRAC